LIKWPERAVEVWLDLTTAKGRRGGALAILLDEPVASAKGEMPLPNRDELADWLRLVQTIFRREKRRRVMQQHWTVAEEALH
jgi:hypothetical protein